MNTSRRRHAMTLVEIMIALLLFGMSVGGLFSMTTMMHRTSVSNVADSVALQAAEGIMEQVRIMPYANLQAAAAAAPGTSTLTFNRYVPAQSDGTAARIDPQEIRVNSAAPVLLDNVDLSTAVNANYVITSHVRLPLGVRLLIREIEHGNFARGVAVELVYTYRYRTTDAQESTHTLRTFIARSVT